MVTTSGGNEVLVGAALDTRRGLLQAEKDLLADEINNDPAERGYAAKVAASLWGDVVDLLRQEYDTVEPDTVTDRTTILPGEFGVLASRAAARAAAQNATDIQKAAWAGVRDAALLATSFASVSLTDPTVAGGITLMVQVGLLTQQEVDAATKTTTPGGTVTNPCRQQSVLGTGKVVEPSDIEALHTENLI